MKAAIIGAGFAGNVHAEAIRACGEEIAVVVCLAEQEAAAFAKKWGIPVWGEDVALALRDEIDSVHICTPPATHGELLRRVLAAGKHVVCEKPLCLDVKEAEQLVELEKASDRVCALMLNVRYHMACRRAREIMASGELGRPVLIHGSYLQEFAAFPAPLDWRYDPGAAGNMRTVTETGTHWLDIVQYITGQKVESVSAQFGKFHPERILKEGFTYPTGSGVEGKPVHVDSEDAAVISLRYGGGAIGSLVLSGVSPGRGNYLSLEITCENGSLWWNEEENNVLQIAGKGEGIRKEIFAFGNGFSDTFTALVRSFYAAVRSGTKDGDYPKFREGADICGICCAVWESAMKDAKWVRSGLEGRI